MQKPHRIFASAIFIWAILFAKGAYPSQIQSNTEILADCKTAVATFDNVTTPKSTIDAVNVAHSLGYCSGYVSGVVDAAQLIFDVNPSTRRFCLPTDGVSNEIVVRAFVDFMAKHQDFLNKTARLTILKSLEEKYPCK